MDLVIPLNSVMRLFAIILSLYITILSLVPCNDSIILNANYSNVELSTFEHGHNDSNCQDGCTPLCICACCGTIITIPTAEDVDLSMPIADHMVCRTLYTFNYSFNYYQGHWHPPTIT